MEIAPELSNEFIKAAEEMAISREYLGCHYPSDSEMGRLWARKFVNELFKKEKFRADFEIAKKEILEYRKNLADKKQTTANQGECSSESTHSCSSACSNSCSSSCSDTSCNSEN